MADVIFENPANLVLPHHRKQLASSIPNIDSLEADGSDEYATMKRLQRHLEWADSEYLAQ